MNSADFNSQPPHITAALHNASDRYTGFLSPPLYDGPFQYNKRRPTDLASHQRSYQTFAFGSWNPAVIALVPNNFFETPEPTYPLDLIGYVGLYDQYWVYENRYYPVVREKFNVPKSYWSGCSRRRRNLPPS